MTATRRAGAPPRPRRPGRDQPGHAVIPGPPLRTLPALISKLWRDRLALLSDAAAEYGDAVRLSMGPKTLYYFNHPDHAKHVLADNSVNYHKGMGLSQAKRILGDGLLTSEGARWRQQRSTIAPAFRRDRLTGFAGLITTEIGTLADRLDAQAGGDPVDVTAEMTRFTLRVLGAVLLDADLSPFGAIGGAFDVAQDQAMFEMVTLGAVPLWLPLRRNYRFRTARRQLEDAVYTLATERELDGGAGGDDVLSLVLAGCRGEPDPGQRERMLRDELITILLAGHETTASTLSWACYLLGRHPEVAARVAAEAAEVLGERVPDAADLHGLRYTTMVIQEVMRLYPPVWGLTRKALGDDTIGGYRVPAGADVMISPYTLHRHPGFWRLPGRFDPERFSPAAAGPAHRYAYIPFGAGPRVCVGSHLGMMEAVFAVAMVMRRFRLELLPGHAVLPEANLSLRVRGGLPVRVTRV